MPIPVPSRPAPDELLRYRVNQPASSMHWRTMAQQLNFLRAYCVEPYASVNYVEPSAEFAAASTINYPILFIPSRGAKLARVQFETQNHTHGNRFQFSAATVDAAAATFIAGSSESFTGDIVASAMNERLRKTNFGYLDVSSYSTTAVHELLLTLTCTEAQKGLASLSVVECPQSMIDPNGNASTEPGVNEAWPDARNRLYEGGSTTGAGTQRFLNEATWARTRMRRHWQIATHESAGYTWLRAAASVGFGQLNYQGSVGTAYDPYHYMRTARRSSAVYNYYKLHARYKWGGAAGTALIRVTCETSEDNWNTILSTTTGTINIVNTAGAYTVGSSTSFGVPIDGAGQRVRLSFGAISDGSDLDITNLALIEEET